MEVPFTVCLAHCIELASRQLGTHESAPAPPSVRVCSGHSFSHQHLNPQLGILTLRIAAKSWGTSAGGVKIRVYTSGGSGNHFQYNSRYAVGWKKTPVTFTITEV